MASGDVVFGVDGFCLVLAVVPVCGPEFAYLINVTALSTCQLMGCAQQLAVNMELGRNLLAMQEWQGHGDSEPLSTKLWDAPGVEEQ